MKKIILFLLCIIMTFSMVSCSVDNGENDIGKANSSVSMALTTGGANPKNAVTAGGSSNIWYASSSQYVLKDEHYADVDTTSLKIFMARNEYEGGQIILSPTENVANFDIAVSDLISSNGVLSKENITVYQEGYIYNEKETNVVRGNNGYITDKWVPDYLIPFDKAKEAGKNNVEANTNQGIYVKVYAPKDTKAGVYSGQFRITVDAKVYDVPVTVTVYDATVSDEVNTASIFMLYNSYLLNSIEGDASDEKLKAYYDFFLKYRLNLMYLPAKTNDVERFLELLVEYYDNPAFTAYCIPYSYKYYFEYTVSALESGFEQPDLDEIQNVLCRIVGMSVKDNKNYLDKAFIYNIYTDEFMLGTEGTYKYEMGLQWSKRFGALCQETVDDFDMAYGTQYLDSVEGLRESLLHVSMINAGSDYQVGRHIIGKKYEYNTVMPEPDCFNSSRKREEIFNEFGDEGDEVWWYTCVGPVSPYPNYHLSNTNSLIDARVLSWMQYDYNIVGNLYYLVNSWVSDKTLTYSENLFDKPRGFGNDDDSYGVYGDGNLIYPGKEFGIYEPLPTLRLESIRDGLEDYALLESINAKCEEYSNYYETVINSNSTLQTIYHKAFNETIATRNIDVLNEARQMIYDNVVLLNSPAKIIIESSYASGDTYFANVLVSDEYTVDGDFYEKQKSGNGYLYKFKYLRGTNDICLTFTATKGSETINYSAVLEKAPTTILSFGDASQLSEFTLSKNSTVAIYNFENKNVTVAHFASTSSKAEMSTFKPKLTIKADDIVAILNKASSVSVDLYNPNDFDIEVQFTMSTNTQKTILLKKTLTANAWTEIELTDLFSITNAKVFSFEFANIVEDGRAVNYDIYFSNLVYKRV